ncbi:urease accessory protein UreF [Halonotius aquaticus]|uniref:Urease accessory protein UreF n=1 Tax=Halonotius aquaticus TaxID=2216978 RepID=A0A3A6PUF2_9EURY|nr:urease accessory UreF family protein [Halonotius aquaticus]RJX41941.1 urease accessory protein UreF [Halonotius aquaticus]
MTSSEALLTALRLSDSMLPVGTYTASYGVEQYLNEDDIETADELGELIEGYLRGVIGPAEIVALGHAHRSAAADDLVGVLAADERLGAATLPAEFRDSSMKAGGKLLELLDEIDDGPFAATETTGFLGEYTAACEDGLAEGHYPVVLGVVCQQAGLGCREAALVSAYGSVTGLLGAAQRLGRFGHTAIQAQLSTLFPVIEEVCEQYYDADLTAMCSFAPLADVRGMAHERADRRLFMS